MIILGMSKRGYRRKFREGVKVASTIYLLVPHDEMAKKAAKDKKISKSRLLANMLERALA